MNFLKYELGYLKAGQRVQVTLDSAANVSVMDIDNFYRYKNGDAHRYYGGHVTRSPYTITVPSSGTYYCCIDLGGYSGSVNASCKTLPSIEEEEARMRAIEAEERRKAEELAEKKRKQEEETRRLKELMEKAGDGDVEAQFDLALRYLEGDGLDQDFGKAKEWYNEASIKGHAPSQRGLAFLYLIGIGIDRDINKAIEYFKKSAEQNNPEALRILAVIYENPEKLSENEQFTFFLELDEFDDEGTIISEISSHVKSDLKKAMSYYLELTKDDDVEAIFKVAIAYETGDGLKKDLKKAFEYFEKATSHGHKAASIKVAEFYLEGKGVERDAEKAYVLFREANDNGDIYALEALVKICLEKDDIKEAIALLDECSMRIGEGFAKFGKSESERKRGIEFVQDKAKGHLVVATGELGMSKTDADELLSMIFIPVAVKCCETGNVEKAIEYFGKIFIMRNYPSSFYECVDELIKKNAFFNLDETARNNLLEVLKERIDKESENKDKNTIAYCGICNNIADNYRLTNNNDKAIEFYQKSLEYKDGYALEKIVETYNNMADNYRSNRQIDKAIEFYKKSLEFKDGYAQEKLIEIYNKKGSDFITGNGIIKNVSTGLEWYQKSAELGSAEAREVISSWKKGIFGWKKIK